MRGIGLKGVGLKNVPFGGGALGMPPWDFNPNLVSFTPGMAKRATSVFAAAPIIQGKRDGSATPDCLDIPRGNLVAGSSFYSNIDTNQGSLTFRITPEWNGNDNLIHMLFSAATGFSLAHQNDNKLGFYNGTGVVSIDISAWVAGTTYNVCLRWDAKNTLDGTNYACISINDVHTFGITASWTPVVPYSWPSIGYFYNAISQPANAIIEGFTVYRRVLYDGTYGVDVGNGDEVNLISAGVDPTTITGSWDVCFCLPTNATPGALVTGTGGAWSHPHSSNLLTRGFLSDRYYGGSQWGVAANGATTEINCGSDAGLDNLTDNALTVEGWFRVNAPANQTLIGKSASANDGWIIFGSSAAYGAGIYCAGGVLLCYKSMVYEDSKWHHIAFTFDDAGDRKIRLYIDGALVLTSDVASGAILADAAANLKIAHGANSRMAGSVGWCRVSNSIRYSADFLPARTPPAADANTLAQWNMTEGTGTTVDNVGTIGAAADGTITAGVWEPQWYDEGSPVRLRSVVGSASYRATITAAAEINNLADAAFTVDGWFRIPKIAASQVLCVKGTLATNGWALYILNSGNMFARIPCVTTEAVAISTSLINDNLWHYIKMTFDDGDGVRKIHIYVDNVEVGYTTQTAGVGAVVSDAAVNGAISDVTYGIMGAHGWIRWSNVVRGAGMIPRSNPPNPADANTIGQWNADEGAGAVLTDLSGEGNNGAMAGTYSWNNSPAMESDSPGARNYAWGYNYGSDAANEGFKQNYTVVAGNNYTFIAGGYSEDGIAKPKIVIRDETAGVDLRTILGTTTSTERVPDRFHTCFQAPAGCTSISIKLLNETATGVVGWQQCMLKSDLWIDAGFEVGTAVTDVGTPTTSAQSADQAHTGVNSWKVVTDADDEGIKRTINVTSGKYYTIRAWMYVATAGKTGKIQFTNGVLQANASVNSINDTTIGAWKCFSCVVRATAATMDVSFLANSGTTFYVDDVSVFPNDDVSLTVTPASAVNSVESGGIRVDGRDLSPQPIPVGRLFTSTGWTRIRYLPRHNGADALKFGSATPYIADWYGDVNNYFYVYWSAANTMTLAFKSAGGVLQTGNWATAGAILAGGNYLLEVRYDVGNMYLYVDNVLRITVTSPIAFTTIPAFCYPATADTVVAGQHDDACYLTP